MSAPVLNASPVEGMTADDAAAHWIVARDRGGDLAGDPAFQAWLGASSQNVDAWTRAQQVWEQFDDLDDPFLDAMRQDALQARAKPRLELAWIAAAFAGAILVLGGAFLALRPPTAVSTVISADAKPDFETATGAQATYALADGSQITLDSGSAVAVRFSADRRAVRLLNGQAYFNVVHDASRPFVTEAGDRVVTDLGTEFDVRLEGAAVSVVLAGGSVSVGGSNRGAAAVVLKPGQRLDADPGSGARVGGADLDQALAWRTGYAEFRDEPLSAALAEMARYGGPPVVITDPRIGAMKVSGRFKTGDIGRFIETLSEIYPLRTRPRSDGGVDVLAR